MSLLSSLFGCGKHSGKPGQYESIPHFPLVDNPSFDVEPVQIDSNYFAQTFILSQDKNHVFVLAYGMEGLPEDMSYQLLRLDRDGKIEKTVLLTHCVVAHVPNFWWEDDGSLSIMLQMETKNFDPVELKERKSWKAKDLKNVIPKKRLEQMVYREQMDAYADEIEKAIRESKKQYVRKVLDLDFLFLEYSRKPSEYWHLQDSEAVASCIKKYGGQKQPLNPATDSSDGSATIKTLAHNILDYKIAYPDLKYIEENILQIAMGKQTAKFKLCNKEKHALHLKFADNNYFASSNGNIWVMYEQFLYKLKVKT